MLAKTRLHLSSMNITSRSSIVISSIIPYTLSRSNKNREANTALISFVFLGESIKEGIFQKKLAGLS